MNKIHYGKCMNKFTFEVVQFSKNIEHCSPHDVGLAAQSSVKFVILARIVLST